MHDHKAHDYKPKASLLKRGLMLNRNFLIGNLFDLAAGRNSHDLQRQLLAAATQRLFCCPLQATAAWNLHPHHSDAFNAIISDDSCQLLGIVSLVQLRTANQGDAAADKTLMKIAISISSTISGYQQICVRKIGGIDGDLMCAL